MLDDPLSFVEFIRRNPEDFLRYLSQHVRLTLFSVLLAVVLLMIAALTRLVDVRREL